MNNRENLISLLRRQGYEYMPTSYNMTPDLNGRFNKYKRDNNLKFRSCPIVQAFPGNKNLNSRSQQFFRSQFDEELDADTDFDIYGVANEAGSKATMHMRRQHHPLKDASTIEEINDYPFPRLTDETNLSAKAFVKLNKMAGKFVMGNMQCTIWETAWYTRSMESLMMDMMCEPELANAVLDVVTENSANNAVAFAKAGVDGIYLGDDIGMQHTIMMSTELYREFIKPRLKLIIERVRAVNPDIIIFYHSCGFIEPFIEDLIEVGVDVLNPIQTECMDFREIYTKYGKRISFAGGIGTQTTMPFSTPAEIEKLVVDTLDFVGSQGGLLIQPTHILEPEVPIENILAYINACEKYKPKK